ncbi:MAG: alkaline phosphatase family protein, partial [Anaerolineales bacterium]|nr:alkaline phosphatase family protein [Anaerolineales bacterium]
MLLLIGLDGATFDLIGPWIQTDQLPQIAKLIRDGVNGRLESTIPPMTAPAWASFMTGKNPGKHGVFDFFSGHPSNPEMVSSQSIKSPVFWDYLGKEGLRTGVLNLPLTYPPREINGYLVPGLMSPEPLGKCHPEDLISRYRDELGDYRLYPRELFEPGSRDDYLEDLNEITSRQTEYALRLFRDNPVDLGVLHLLAPDLGQHKLWQYSDPGHPWSEHDGLREGGNLLLDLFVHLDEAIGRLISAIPENSTVILMSDHGFGPQVHSINLNLHLVRAGLLKLNGSPVSLLHRWDIRWGRKPTLTSVFSIILGRDLSAGFHNVDWPATRAYAFGHMGQVYLTAKAPAKKDLDLVIETLLALRDPENDRPLVSEILRRDEIF